MSSVNPSATVLSEGAQVDGDLILNHNATVAGEITGDLRCAGTLELTATAHVHGDVHADAILIAGRVGGSVTANQDIGLRPGVQVGCGITAARLTATDGVTYDGTLRLTGDTDQKAPAAETTAPPKLTIKRNRVAVSANETNQGFHEVTGAAHAGLRPRRRTPLPSVI